jgi:hypothetical protein
MKPQASVALGVLALLLAAPRAPAARLKPVTAYAGQMAVFAGTQIGCNVEASRDVVCARVGTDGRPTPRTHDFRLQPEGKVIVYTVDRSGKTTFAYTRVLARARTGDRAPLLLARSGQVVKIDGTNTVCVGDRSARPPSVVCRRGAREDRAQVDRAGNVSILTTGGVSLWASTGRTVVRTGDAFAVTFTGSRIACLVALLNGNQGVECNQLEPNGIDDGDSFVAFTQGLITAFARSGGQLKQAGTFGTQAGLSAHGRTTSNLSRAKALAILGRGGLVHVGSSPLVCTPLERPPGLLCGLTDDRGGGVPGSYAAVIRGSGGVEIYRFDRNRKPALVLRTRKG